MYYVSSSACSLFEVDVSSFQYTELYSWASSICITISTMSFWITSIQQFLSFSVNSLPPPLCSLLYLPLSFLLRTPTISPTNMFCPDLLNPLYSHHISQHVKQYIYSHIFLQYGCTREWVHACMHEQLWGNACMYARVQVQVHAHVSACTISRRILLHVI